MKIRQVTATAALCALVAGGTGAAYAASESTTGTSSTSKSSSSSTASKPGDCRGPRAGRPGGGPFADIASALGIKASALQKQLREGKKLSAIATAQGKTLDQVKAAVKASLETKLDKEVKAGTISQSEADERLSHVESMIDDIEAGKKPPHGRGGRPGAPPAGGDPPSGA